MIQIMSHDQRYETQYLWGIKLSLFSPSARKNINLHYIIIIMIKTSSSHWITVYHPQHSEHTYCSILYNILHTNNMLHWRHTAMTLTSFLKVRWGESSIPPHPPHTGSISSNMAETDALLCCANKPSFFIWCYLVSLQWTQSTEIKLYH